jgi:lipocalin
VITISELYLRIYSRESSCSIKNQGVKMELEMERTARQAFIERDTKNANTAAKFVATMERLDLKINFTGFVGYWVYKLEPDRDKWHRVNPEGVV